MMQQHHTLRTSAQAGVLVFCWRLNRPVLDPDQKALVRCMVNYYLSGEQPESCLDLLLNRDSQGMQNAGHGPAFC